MNGLQIAVLIDNARREGITQGNDEGYAEGLDIGFEEGYNEALNISGVNPIDIIEHSIITSLQRRS